jgi:hypothetical protein
MNVNVNVLQRKEGVKRIIIRHCECDLPGVILLLFCFARTMS